MIVRRGDVELSVTIAGAPDATPVVLVHGYPDTHAVWDDVAAGLVHTHRVIRYDVRGAGASTRPRGDHAYDLVELADDLVAVIDACSPGRRVHLVGHDWGSMESWELVGSDRGATRLASFTTISGPCLDHVGHWMKEASPREIAAQLRRSWYILALQVPGLARLAWPLVAPRFPAMLARREGTPIEPRPTLVADAVACSARYRRNVRRRMRHPRPDPHARVPVQLVVPRRDPYVSPALLEQVPRWARDLTVRELDAGHWCPRTHGAQLARWIAEVAV